MVRADKKNSGFNLIGLAMALVVAGLAVGTMVQKYRIDRHNKPFIESQLRKDEIEEALVRYLTTNGALPRPAPPGLPFNHPKAGISIDDDAYNQLMSHYNFASPSLSPWCDPDTTSLTFGMCVVRGGRHTGANTASGVDPVVIGSIPYANLGISLGTSLDGWKNRLTYAVSAFLTDPTKFSDQYGVIDQQNYNRTTTPNITSTFNKSVGAAPGTPKSYLFAVVSHGADGKGAFNYFGRRPVACGSAAGYDNENCDGDAVFLANASGRDDSDSAVYSTVPGTQFYDDSFVLTRIVVDTDKWTFAAAGSKKMRNKTGEKVGIGVANPAYNLHVSDNIKLDNYQVTELCDSATNNCFQQDFLSPGPGSADVYCRSSVATGIYSSQMACMQKIATTGITDFTSCGSGEYITGFIGGVRQCAAP